jgi:hypothetical protein
VWEMERSVNPKGSPGMPLQALGQSNLVVIGKYGDFIENAVYERLVKLGTADLSGSFSPQDLVKAGLCDPVRLFVKQEPHKINKIKTKRFRLISSVSLIDQLVERVLFGVQNRKEIECWKLIPSKPGIGLTDDLARCVFNEVRNASNCYNMCEADISGWDWSVQLWELLADAEIRVRLSRGAHPLCKRAMINRMQCLARSVFSLSNGKLFEQGLPGLMKSGSYLTSSTNSRCRVLDHHVLGGNWIIAMGDDSIEADISTETESGAERYGALGKIVGMYDYCPVDQKGVTQDFEFCSQRFTSSGPIPQNWAKMLTKFLSSEMNDSLKSDLKQELRHLEKKLRKKVFSYLDNVVGSERPQNLDE